MRNVGLCRHIDHLLKVSKAGYSGAAESLLQEAEAPVRRKLGVGNYEEGEGDVMVQTYYYSSDEVMEHGIVLVLPHTVVCMQVNICFSQAMLLEEVVEQRDNNCVGPLPCVAGFVDEVVDLPGDASQYTPKIPHLRGVRKYMGPGWRGSEG